jgi:hypothetical protein
MTVQYKHHLKQYFVSCNKAYMAVSELCNGEKSRFIICSIYQLMQVYKLTK